MNKMAFRKYLRTEFNPEKLMESLANLKKYEFLKDKVTCLNGYVIINFHKYFKIEFSDDLCMFFDTHCHPQNNEEVLYIIDYLIDEQMVFFHRYRFPSGKQRYTKDDLPMLLRKKNKKYCRVFQQLEFI